MAGNAGHHLTDSSKRVDKPMTDFQRYHINVGEWKIHVLLGGSGPLILFLHGFGQSSVWWTEMMDRLSDDFSVCAIDLPGSGASSRLTTQPRPDEYRVLIENVVSSVGRGPAVLVGHSLGGFVAVQAMAQQARGVCAVALAAPAGFGPVKNLLVRSMSIPVLGELLMLSGRLGAPMLFVSMVRKRASIPKELIDTIDLSPSGRDELLRQLRMGIRFGVTSKGLIFSCLPSLDVPKLLIWGRFDSVFPLRFSTRAHEMLETSHLRIFDASGHFPFLEEPARFESELRAFIAKAGLV